MVAFLISLGENGWLWMTSGDHDSRKESAAASPEKHAWREREVGDGAVLTVIHGPSELSVSE